MKEKLNMYTVCMAGWIMGVMVTIYCIYKNMDNVGVVNLILAGVVFWMTMMLFIQDVAKPVSERRFCKGMEGTVWKDYILCLVADVCIVFGFLGYLATANYLFLAVIFLLILIRGMKRTSFFHETVKR